MSTYDTGVSDRLKDKASEFADTATYTAGKVKDRASDAIQTAREYGRSAARSATAQVQMHPLPSVGVALITGLVLGIVLDRLLAD